MITLLDTVDRTEELNFLLHNAPTDTSSLVKGTDPRTSAFTSSERSVGNFRRSGKLRIVIGDVRDEVLMKTVLNSGTPVVDSAQPKRRPKARPHPGDVEAIPPVTGIIHLAAYSPTDCRVNPVDCESVETGGMNSILKAFAREAVDNLGVQSIAGRASLPDRPWLVIPRRQQGWADVSSEMRLDFETLLIIIGFAAAGFLPLQRLAGLSRRLDWPRQRLHYSSSSPFATPHPPVPTFLHRRSARLSLRPDTLHHPISTRPSPDTDPVVSGRYERIIHRDRRCRPINHSGSSNARTGVEEELRTGIGIRR